MAIKEFTNTSQAKDIDTDGYFSGQSKERELTANLSKSRITQLMQLKEELDSKGEDTSHIDAELFALQG